MLPSPQPPQDKRASAFKPTIVQFPGGQQLNVQQKLGNLRAEEAVLASVLQKSEVYHALAEMLQPGDFTLRWNGIVWRTFEVLAARNESISIITVADELEKHGELDDVRLAALAGRVDDIDSAESYARMVRDAALQIRIIQAAMEMIIVAQDDKNRGFTEFVVDECNRLLFEATEQRMERSPSFYQVLSTYSDSVERVVNDEEPPTICVPSGFDRLDSWLKGFAPGEVTVIGGGAGQGKTTFALSIARNILNTGGSVAYFSLEMSQEEILRSLTAMETGIPKDVLRSKRLTPEQYATFIEAAGRMSKWAMHPIDEYKSLTPLQLRRRLRLLATQEVIDMVMIDGLWLMEAVKPTPRRVDDVHFIVRDLTEIADAFNLPIAILHQYKRSGDGSKKRRIYTEEDLAESSGVERNVDVILCLQKPKHLGVVEGIIYKDRNGSTPKGTMVEFAFNRKFKRYEQL